MDLLLLGLLLVVFVALPLISLRKQNQRMKEIRTFQDNLHPNMVVKTTSGMHGRISHIGETTVDLEISAGVVTTWDRTSILALVDSVESGSQQADQLCKDPEAPEEQ